MFKFLGLALLSLASFAQITTLPPASGSGGGGSATRGYGMTGSGDVFDVNTAVIPSHALIQAGGPVKCVSATGNATMTCTVTPTLTAYTSGGTCLILTSNFANVTTATLNVDTIGAVSVLGPFGSALAAGDIPANQPVHVCYNGTAFIKQGFSYLVFDPTAVTGSTKLAIRAGAGQSGNMQEWQNNAGGVISGITAAGYGSFPVISMDGWWTLSQTGSGGIAFGSGHVIAWGSSATNSATGTVSGDSGLARNAAGIVEVNNGTAGTYRDLLQRHPLAGGTSPTITSGFGTTPSIAGKDAAGRVTVGTGGTAATGTITFGTAWATAPACTAANETTQLVLFPTATTTTLVLASTTPFTAADKLVWICVGY